MTLSENLSLEREAMSRSRERCCTTMIRRLAALILFGTETLILTAELPHLMVERGNNVTLTCPLSKGKFFYWYKQSLGHMLERVASRIVDVPEVTDSRFKLTKGDDGYLLTISNVSKEDEATYFCQNGTSYRQTFTSGTFLAVNDQNQPKHYCMKQTPETVSVGPGGSVTLQCSLLSKHKENSVQCPGEHRVHWFRAGSGQSQPGIIYTQSSRSDEQEQKSCVYSLSKTIQNSSDAGTYHCAVVTCGNILFGGGTKVEMRSELDPLFLVLAVLLACCVTVIVVLSVKVNQRVCKHCKGAMSTFHHQEHDRSSLDESNDLEGEVEALNYVAPTFFERKAKRMEKKRESPHQCVYSSVKQISSLHNLHLDRKPPVVQEEGVFTTMFGQLATLILLLSVSLTQTAEVPPQISLMVVEVGQNATLKCQVSEKEGKFFHWYKQTPGYLFQTVATGTFSKQSLSEQFKNSRFTVTEEKSHYSLNIINVEKEDEATYSCQNGTAYSQTFVNGIFLVVNDQNQQKSALVKQSPETVSVQMGASVTLQCSLFSKNKEDMVQCPGEHSVHWFTAGSGHLHPGIIYTHKNTSDEQGCVYRLPRTIQKVSDAGTYYCAMVTCGEILFGGGTKVETISAQEHGLLVIVLGGLLALCLIVIIILIFSKY
ncbi:uncharacterized protein [Paralichthys olivaceus]|uniref:uncharacterized protein n=1 Tax=Paralichthys olivaceus TaxID=8255 RepID=UPI003751E40F